jgi:putative methyltransferase (TIGR04325 family)
LTLGAVLSLDRRVVISEKTGAGPGPIGADPMMKQIKKAAKWLLPPILLLPFRPGFRNEPNAAPRWHRGDYPNWSSAAAAARGYNAANILDIQRAAMRKVRDGEAVYERDSVLFDEIEYFFPTLASLLLIASRNGNRLSVLDFGGALGSSYYQNRAMLAHLEHLSWHVVEQPHFVAAGQAEFQNDQLRFFPTIAESAAASSPDVVLLSSVLQYLESPLAFLANVMALKPHYILVDRTPVLDAGRERIVVQTVPPSIYPASYACRLFAPQVIETALAPAYRPLYGFEAHIGTEIVVDSQVAHYRGMLFQRVETA